MSRLKKSYLNIMGSIEVQVLEVKGLRIILEPLKAKKRIKKERFRLTGSQSKSQYGCQNNPKTNKKKKALKQRLPTSNCLVTCAGNKAEILMQCLQNFKDMDYMQFCISMPNIRY